MSLSGNELRKIGKGLLIAMAGAALTYLAQTIPNVDFGAYTPVVVASFSVIVNAAQKLLSDTRSGV